MKGRGDADYQPYFVFSWTLRKGEPSKYTVLVRTIQSNGFIAPGTPLSSKLQNQTKNNLAQSRQVVILY